MKCEMTFAESGYSSANIQLFSDVGDIDQLIGDFPVRQYAAGTEVPAVVGGDAQLYIVLQGALRVSIQKANAVEANGTDIFGEVLPGECVGELSVLGGERRGVVIRAMQNTDLLAIDSPRLLALIDELSGFARKLLMLRSPAGLASTRRSGNQDDMRDLIPGDATINVGLGYLQDRAWLDDNLPGMTDLAHRNNEPFSMLMIRLAPHVVDGKAPDQPFEDEEFSLVSALVIESLRPTDFAAHFVENQIAVMLPNANAQGAITVAQRLSDCIGKAAIFSGGKEPPPHISVSFGIACLSSQQTAKDLIDAAVAGMNHIDL